MEILKIKKWLKQKRDVQFEIWTQKLIKNKQDQYLSGTITSVIRLKDRRFFRLGQSRSYENLYVCILSFSEDCIHVTLDYGYDNQPPIVVTCPIDSIYLTENLISIVYHEKIVKYLEQNSTKSS